MSAEHAGVAAALRAQKMHSKYREACLRIDSTFRDGVIERYGHCGDLGFLVLWGLCGSLRVRGIGNRRSRTILPRLRRTYVAQRVVFGAVMSDAAMLDAVLNLDVWGKGVKGTFISK